MCAFKWGEEKRRGLIKEVAREFGGGGYPQIESESSREETSQRNVFNLQSRVTESWREERGQQ